MPELPELEVVREILDRRVVGESIVRAEAVLPGSAIVVRDSTGRGFSTALAGATVELGVPRGGFRTFTAGEALPAVIGPQGGVMLQARVRIGGATAPACVEAESTLTVDGTASWGRAGWRGRTPRSAQSSAEWHEPTLHSGHSHHASPPCTGL